MKSFQKGPPPEKVKLKRWWTYLSQLRLKVHYIPGIKNELSDYISRNNFDALIGESCKALAKEAFQRMDVQLDLSMRTAGILEGWSLTDYQSEYKEILQTLSTGPSVLSNPTLALRQHEHEQAVSFLTCEKRTRVHWGTRKATQCVNAAIRHMHREHSAYSNPTCALRAPFASHTFHS